MMKKQPIPYKVAATFIRGNIGHFGHADLVEKMLNRAEVAHIHLSGASHNNNYEMRELLMKVLLRHRGIPMERVNFHQTPNVNEALKQSISEAPFGEVIFCVGEDRSEMAFHLADYYDTAFFLNRRLTSSTSMRFFIDDADLNEELLYCYEGNSYAVTLAKLLRKEELLREESAQIAAKTRSVTA